MQSPPKPSAILFENLEPRLLLSVNDLGLVDPGDFSPPIGYARQAWPFVPVDELGAVDSHGFLIAGYGARAGFSPRGLTGGCFGGILVWSHAAWTDANGGAC